MQRVGRRLNDVARGIEIRLANFEMNNVSAFCLQRSRLHQDFKRSLSPETRHTLGEAKFVGLSHDGEMSIKEKSRNLSFSGHDEGSLLTSHPFSPSCFVIAGEAAYILPHRERARKLLPIATSPKLASARIIVSDQNDRPLNSRVPQSRKAFLH
jgi:hypothetical protein